MYQLRCTILDAFKEGYKLGSGKELLNNWNDEYGYLLDQQFAICNPLMDRFMQISDEDLEEIYYTVAGAPRTLDEFKRMMHAQAEYIKSQRPTMEQLREWMQCNWFNEARV